MAAGHRGEVGGEAEDRPAVGTPFLLRSQKEKMNTSPSLRDFRRVGGRIVGTATGVVLSSLIGAAAHAQAVSPSPTPITSPIPNLPSIMHGVRVVTEEPPAGTLDGVFIYVNNGSCPQGQILLVEAGTRRGANDRKRSCVPIPQ
jgi:hypothetical protein